MDTSINNPEKENPKKPQESWSHCLEIPLCAVLSSINDSVIFVDYDQKLHCPFSMSFGNGFVCNRKERLSYFLANNC